MSIRYATCLVCGGDLEQWSVKKKNGDRKFMERCPVCKQQWSTGTVTMAEWEALSGVAAPFIKKQEEKICSDDDSTMSKKFANGLRTVNDILTKRKILK